MDNLKSLRDKGWKDMEGLLDKEMPIQKQKRRGLLYLIFGLGLIGLLALVYNWSSFGLKDSKAESALIASLNQTETPEEKEFVDGKKTANNKVLPTDEIAKIIQTTQLEPASVFSNERQDEGEAVSLSSNENDRSFSVDNREVNTSINNNIVRLSKPLGINQSHLEGKNNQDDNLASNILKAEVPSVTFSESQESLTSDISKKETDRNLINTLSLRARQNELLYERSKINTQELLTVVKQEAPLSWSPYIASDISRFNNNPHYNFGGGLMITKGKYTFLLGAAYGFSSQVFAGSGQADYPLSDELAGLGGEDAFGKVNYDYSGNSTLKSKHIDLGFRYNFYKNIHAYLGYRFSNRSLDFNPLLTSEFVEVENNALDLPNVELSINQPEIENFHNVGLGLEFTFAKYIDLYIVQDFRMFSSDSMDKYNAAFLTSDSQDADVNFKVESFPYTNDNLESSGSNVYEFNQSNQIRLGLKFHF